MKNHCKDCKKLCSGNYCQSCYLNNHNPFSDSIIIKKISNIVKQNKSKSRENNPNYIDGRSFKKNYCTDCGVLLARYTAKRCRQCSNKNIFYIHGESKNKYSKEFNINLKEKIRKRDNYTCQISGITEEEHILIYGNCLSVHHIDYDKNNNNPENLISLGNEAHARTNRNRKYWETILTKKVMSYR